jgi:hypothetical protein
MKRLPPSGEIDDPSEMKMNRLHEWRWLGRVIECQRCEKQLPADAHGEFVDEEKNEECPSSEERVADAETGFHNRDGWFYKRLDNGVVRISHVLHPPIFGRLVEQFCIPENEWASIVCSVSEAGETSERWMAARRFHGLRDSTI